MRCRRASFVPERQTDRQSVRQVVHIILSASFHRKVIYINIIRYSSTTVTILRLSPELSTSIENILFHIIQPSSFKRTILLPFIGVEMIFEWSKKSEGSNFSGQNTFSAYWKLSSETCPLCTTWVISLIICLCIHTFITSLPMLWWPIIQYWWTAKHKMIYKMYQRLLDYYMINMFTH